MQSNFLQLFIRTEFSEKKLLENKELYFNNGVTNTQAQVITKAKTRVTNEQNRPTDGHRYSSEVPKPIVGDAASVVLSV